MKLSSNSDSKKEDLYVRTPILQFTEIWFRWIGWIVVCSGFYIYAYKSNDVIAYILFYISSGLTAFSIGYTAMDIMTNLIRKDSEYSLSSYLILIFTLLNPVLVVILFHEVIKIVIEKM